MTTEEDAEAGIIRLTKPQFELVTTDKQFPAFVGGFGSGKTGALIKRAIRLKFVYPGQNIAYYLPTFSLIGDIAIPRFIEALAEIGMEEGDDFKVISSQRPRIEIFAGGDIILRSMDNPAKIVGYEVADSFADELDTLEADKARLVWQKMLARNRQKKPDGAPNTIAVGTTPEGFRFVYERWKRAPPSDKYQLIKASTYSNARNLPEGYIQDLIDDYPSNLIQAYLDGEFVNLTSGAVYPEFDRELNRSSAVIVPGEPLHIGMDFNVGKMTAVVFVQRDGWPHAVQEVTGVLDTPAMILAIKRRFPNHAIFIYPDASGASRKSNDASVSDIALLQQAGFTVFNNKANPAVRDRILSMNRLIHANSIRRLKVNPDTCPAFAEGLEKQAYNDKGEPDKSSGLDHAVDAGGYFICYRFPVVSSRVQKVKVGGI